MKRVFIIFCLIPILVQAQQFTTIRIEDKNGLKDSVFVACGLSDEQIDSIPFYTTDQVYQSWQDSSSHWAWIEVVECCEQYQIKYGQTYIYKPYGGYIDGGRRNIIFPADRLPVTITWDKQFFIDNNLKGSVISDMSAWFDCVAGDEEIRGFIPLIESDTCTLHNTSDRVDYQWGSYRYIEDLFVKFIGLSIGTIDNLSQSISKVQRGDVQCTKVIRDGQLLIECNGKTYNAQGAEVR